MNTDDDFGSMKIDHPVPKPVKPAAKKPGVKPVVPPAPKPAVQPAPAVAAPTPGSPPKKVPESIGPKTRVTAKLAADVCGWFDLSPAGRKRLRPEHTPREFLDELLEAELFEDGVRFLAHALPEREAVWWAAQALRMLHDRQPPPGVGQALEIAEKWVREPGEETRARAGRLATRVGYDNPYGCTLAAAYFNADHRKDPLKPAENPAPGEAEHVTQRFVAGALLLAGIMSGPTKPADERLPSCLVLGIRVANGANRWKSEPATT